MVISRNQPYRPEQVERHAFTVIGDGDCGLVMRSQLEVHNDLICISIVCVLDQLEDRQPGAPYQLVTEKLQHSGPRPEWLVEFVRTVLTQGCMLCLLVIVLYRIVSSAASGGKR